MASEPLVPLIDAGLRGGAFSLLLLLTVLLLRQTRRAPSAFYGGLLCLSAAAYVVVSWPALAAFRASPACLPVAVLSMGTPALFLAYARANFDDDFKPSWRDPLPWGISAVLGLLCTIARLPLACSLFQLSQLVWIGFAIGVALTGRAADLVEERRHYRLVVVIASCVYSAAIVLLETRLHSTVFAAPLSATTAGGLFALVFALALWGISLSGGRFMPAAAAPRRPPAPEPAEPPAEDHALLARLRQVMETERAYREPGLAIAGLAGRLEIPEYRLRRLINQGLGHRNFSSFVNGYRLADALAALADPGQAEVPVITIALDAGFQSLGPFNRAFKAQTGVTPTDYRRQRLGGAENRAPASPNSEIGKPIPG
jgi:AraC-like DNA-binding protein